MKYKNSLLILLGLTMLLLPACNNEAANAESDKQDETEVNVEDQNKSNSTNVQTSGEQKVDSFKDQSIANQKDKFIKKLQHTKSEVEQLEVIDSSTYALKDVENKRYDLWDDLLNEIYGVLENQLAKEEMDLLREEQRLWITTRDETALEASLKYKGGTQEHLEYVAVLANLTEERCYELVEEYLS